MDRLLHPEDIFPVLMRSFFALLDDLSCLLDMVEALVQAQCREPTQPHLIQTGVWHYVYIPADVRQGTVICLASLGKSFLCASATEPYNQTFT